MEERLTWEQIQEKYPDQWIGLVNVKYIDNDGISVESAIVKYIGLTRDELTEMMIDGKCISRFTTPDNVFQLGMIGV